MAGRRNPPAKWVLPDVVDPPDHICITVPVPNDRKHIGAFYGAIFNLTSARFWQDDLAHTAKDVALVWREIFDNLAPGACDFNVPDLIDEMEYQMSICEQLRFHNGKLQGLCCGEWVNIDGQSTIDIGGPDQQGSGADQPTAGECTTYHASFSAKSTYLVPTVVNAGDTLEFTNAKGAGQDGTVSPWHCPDGSQFFGGACVGVGGPFGGDPAAAINHMALIALINGTYYSASSGTITVPGGVANAEVTLQVNDSSLTDNSGSYVVDVAVCNNLPVAWQSVWDFTLTPGLMTELQFVAGTTWMPGTGWVTQPVGGQWNADLDMSFASAVLTHAEISWQEIGTFFADLANKARFFATDIVNPLITGSNTSGVGLYDNPAGVSATDIDFRIFSNVAVGTGQVIYKKLLVRGIGAKPPTFP